MRGDFNGDRRTGIAPSPAAAPPTCTSPSNGTRFVGTGVTWHDFFAVGNEVPAPGILW
jgi:hypothetical protein